jgi:hypothetical protein
MQEAVSVLERVAGDPARGRDIALQLVERERPQSRDLSNSRAGQVVWVARLFDEEAVGGPDAVREAIETLERNQWIQLIREPEQWRALAHARAPA